MLIFEKAENLTDGGQDYLEQILDDTANTKAIFCCNENKFTGPFASRLEKFHFERVNNEGIMKMLSWISEKEGFSIPQKLSDQILTEANGIPRDALRGLYQYIWSLA